MNTVSYQRIHMQWMLVRDRIFVWPKRHELHVSETPEEASTDRRLFEADESPPSQDIASLGRTVMRTEYSLLMTEGALLGLIIPPSVLVTHYSYLSLEKDSYPL